jgi:hypothetical protein
VKRPPSLNPDHHRAARWRCDWSDEDLARLDPASLEWLAKFAEEYLQDYRRKGQPAILNSEQRREAGDALNRQRRDVVNVDAKQMAQATAKKTPNPYAPEEYMASMGLLEPAEEEVS